MTLKNFLIEKCGTPLNAELRSSLPDTFTNPFSYSPHPLCEEAMMEVCSYLNSNSRISALGLLGDGKMFGVLIAESAEGELGYLAAYSGVLDYLNTPSPLDMELGIGKVEEPFFVPPVYDLTSQESFFPAEEREITSLNGYISDLVHDSFAQGVSERMEEIKAAYKAEIDALQQKYEEGKARRDALRKAGAGREELDVLVKCCLVVLLRQCQKLQCCKLCKAVVNVVEGGFVNVHLILPTAAVFKEGNAFKIDMGKEFCIGFSVIFPIYTVYVRNIEFVENLSPSVFEHIFSLFGRSILKYTFGVDIGAFT